LENSFFTECCKFGKCFSFYYFLTIKNIRSLYYFKNSKNYISGGKGMIEGKEWVKRKRWAKEILRVLDVHPELSAYEISKITGISYATVRKYLRLLEKMGYVKCLGEVTSERGGGKIAYTITEEGKGLVEELKIMPQLMVPQRPVGVPTPLESPIRVPRISTLGIGERESISAYIGIILVNDKGEIREVIPLTGRPLDIKAIVESLKNIQRKIYGE